MMIEKWLIQMVLSETPCLNFRGRFCLGPQPRNNQAAFRGLPSCDGFIGMRTLAPWYDVGTLTYKIHVWYLYLHLVRDRHINIWIEFLW